MIVRIKNLRLRVIVGVHEWEQRHPRDVTANIELEIDAAQATRSDELGDTVDYAALKQRVVEAVESRRFNLLEALASKLLEAVLADEKVRSASVEVDKPGALSLADSVSVTARGSK